MTIKRETHPYRLLTPGPVPLPPEVLAALGQKVRHHRTPEFLEVLDRVWSGLKWFFQTEQSVMVLTSTGSGAMEAALVNTLSRGDRVLALVSGKFGERWAEMAERFGAQVERLNFSWGEPIDLDRVKKKLTERADWAAVLCQAVETSTATSHPIQQLAQLIHDQSSALVLIDAITGLGAMPIPMDTWGLDVVISGSQKALMLPTGLSFIALSKRAEKAQEKAQMPRYYFDLKQERAANKKGQTFFSSANSHIIALDVVLTRFRSVGLNSLISRCESLARATRNSLNELGLATYSKSPASSVTAALAPSGVDGAKLRDHLESQYNLTVMGGQDQLQGKILRIGHLGHIENEDMEALVILLSSSLRDLGHDVSQEREDRAKSLALKALSAP